MRRPSLLVPVALSCAVLAGCAGAPAATTTPPVASVAPAASADAAGWMDAYCGALSGISDTARKMPAINLAAPEKMIAGFSSYVDDYVAAMDDAIAKLKTVGPAPSPVGDAAVTELSTSLATFRKNLAKIKKELSASSTADIDKVLEPLSGLEDPPDPLKAVAKDPQLSAAAKSAPSCQKIQGST